MPTAPQSITYEIHTLRSLAITRADNIPRQRWPEVAIALFCQKIDGLVFNLNYQNTSVKFN